MEINGIYQLEINGLSVGTFPRISNSTRGCVYNIFHWYFIPKHASLSPKVIDTPNETDASNPVIATVLAIYLRCTPHFLTPRSIVSPSSP